MLSRSIKAQSGISLISMMVGITISLITSVAMLTMFRHSIKIAADTRVMSQQDGERTSAMTIAPILLQDAGFGINDADVDSNMIAIKDAAFTGNKLTGNKAGAGEKANAIIWRRNLGAGMECSALFAAADKGLQKLGPVNCASLAAWGNLTWNTQPLAIIGSFDFVLTKVPANCTQFGYASTGKATVEITSGNATGRPVRSLSCLSNLVVA